MMMVMPMMMVMAVVHGMVLCKGGAGEQQEQGSY